MVPAIPFNVNRKEYNVYDSDGALASFFVTARLVLSLVEKVMIIEANKREMFIKVKLSVVILYNRSSSKSIIDYDLSGARQKRSKDTFRLTRKG